MSSTPRTESTGPASSATDTTQTTAGATTATGRKPAPSAKAFARERRRKKKYLERVEQVRQLANERGIEVLRLRDQIRNLELQQARTAATLHNVQARMDWLARYNVEHSDCGRCVEIRTRIRVHHSLICQAGTAITAYLLNEIIHQSRLSIANTEIAGLLKSPITLQDNEDAGRILLRAKCKWIEGVMRAYPRSFPAWKTLNNPHRDLGALWDDAFQALKSLATSIPPDTTLVRVTTPPPRA